jgi:hypothetical protein
MIGVKNFIEQFRDTIDWDAKAKKIAKKESISVKEVKDQWEKDRVTGIKIHKSIIDSEDKDAIIYTRMDDGLYRNNSDNDIDNKFPMNGVFIERPISNKIGLIGYPDKVIVKNGKVSIIDHKSWKKCYRTSLRMAENGFKIPPKKFFSPIEYMDDCNYNEACLQLSFYANMIWENNKNLKIDKLYINHISHANGKITSQVLEEVPYLRDEVKKMLKTLKI